MKRAKAKRYVPRTIRRHKLVVPQEAQDSLEFIAAYLADLVDILNEMSQMMYREGLKK